MAEQRKTVSEIIEEMRRELKEDNDPEASLFKPYLAKARGRPGPKKKKAVRKTRKKGIKAKKKRKPTKKRATSKAKRKAGKKKKKKRH